MKTYHLLHDFGIYKQTVVSNFRDNDRGREYDHVRDLLAKRTQRYTLAELRELAGFFWTSHDECVVGNTNEFSNIEVYTAARKIEMGSAAADRIERLYADEQRPDTLYSVALVNDSDGSFDVVERFTAESDEAANAYAEQHYPEDEWFVLDSQGRNINANLGDYQ